MTNVDAVGLRDLKWAVVHVAGSKDIRLLSILRAISMTKDRIDDRDPVEIADDFIDDVDRTRNPLGRFYRHNHMHADTIPMALDEFGRCAKREWTSFRWELIYPTVTAGAESRLGDDNF